MRLGPDRETCMPRKFLLCKNVSRDKSVLIRAETVTFTAWYSMLHKDLESRALHALQGAGTS